MRDSHSSGLGEATLTGTLEASLHDSAAVAILAAGERGILPRGQLATRFFPGCKRTVTGRPKARRWLRIYFPPFLL